MNVFLFGCDTDAFRHLSVDERDFDVLEGFQVKPFAEEWSPIAVELGGRADLPIPDIFQLDYRIPVLTHAAFQVLHSDDAEGIEGLELSSPHLRLVALNIFHSCDCLDTAQSGLRTNRFGNVIEVQDGVFDYAKIAAKGFFTIPSYGGVFFTEPLHDRLVQNGLTGLLSTHVGVAV